MKLGFETKYSEAAYRTTEVLIKQNYGEYRNSFCCCFRLHFYDLIQQGSAISCVTRPVVAQRWQEVSQNLLDFGKEEPGGMRTANKRNCYRQIIILLQLFYGFPNRTKKPNIAD